MKTILSILILLCSIISFAQDQTQIVVNISNSVGISFQNLPVKQKATVLEYRPIIGGTKDFYIKLRITYYLQSAGNTYGGKVIDLIQSSGATQEQKNAALQAYQDRIVEYQSTGNYVTQATGLPFVVTDPQNIPIGVVPDYQYWQSFNLTQAGISSLSSGAMASMYQMIVAKVTAMNNRGLW